MADNSDEIISNIRYLRRYARALLGSQQVGDQYVRVCLETLLSEPERLPAGSDVRLGLFRLFHQAWNRTGAAVEGSRALESDDGNLVDLSVESRLQALPAPERQALLLTSLEGFSPTETAQILDRSEAETRQLLTSAWTAVNQQVATSILVIEDEPVIALDIAALVADLGHKVVGIASSQKEAVGMAREFQPGLILADIDLGAGGSGLVAVTEILQGATVPVIFVTAYPERLLTGERPEPTYLVTKPFESDTLKVTISQALSFSRAEERKQVAV
jgi:DNA-directed RNA polymerase specialized sigma24 family protein/CheY-like chemotaxis protein